MSNIAPTTEEFILAYPAFSLIDEALIDNAIDFSSRLLDQTAWGDFYFNAIGLDVAHMLTLGAMIGNTPSGGVQAAVGPVSSVSAAGVSTSFNSADVVAGSKSDSWYSKTMYGQMFLRLRDNVISMGIMCS
jgi:hypothetical protein